MNKQFHKRTSPAFLLAGLASILVVMLALAFSVAVEPAQAQSATATATVTATATTAGGGAGTPTHTPTATRAATLGAPTAAGTPTALIPVTGADLTQPGGRAHLGTWIALWLLGLVLLGFGLRYRLSKR